MKYLQYKTLQDVIEEYYTQPPELSLHTNYRANGESLTLPLFIISKLQVFLLWRSDLHIQAVVIYPIQTSCNSPSMISTSIAFL